MQPRAEGPPYPSLGQLPRKKAARSATALPNGPPLFVLFAPPQTPAPIGSRTSLFPSPNHPRTTPTSEGHAFTRAIKPAARSAHRSAEGASLRFARTAANARAAPVFTSVAFTAAFAIAAPLLSATSPASALLVPLCPQSGPPIAAVSIATIDARTKAAAFSPLRLDIS
jgi:hypothetical protein